MIEKYIESIKKSLNDENWYTALSLSLALPDICGGIDFPNEVSSKRRFFFGMINLSLQNFLKCLTKVKAIYY